MSPLERRYRRMLRLLPAGYRQSWEEDMVSAFLQSADGAATGRPSFGERLSVVALALRLRLAAPNSPGGTVWHRTVHVFALLVLLYQALAAVDEAVGRVAWQAWSGVDALRDPFGLLLSWGETSAALPWIAAFICLVLGRIRAARVLALAGGAATIGLAVAIEVKQSATVGPPAMLLPSVGNASRWGWLVVSVLAVFLVSARQPVRRAVWWLGGFLVAAVALAAWQIVVTGPVQSWPFAYMYWNLAVTMRVGLLVGMAVALARAASRRPEPHWLLALGVLGAFSAGVRVARFVEVVSVSEDIELAVPIMGFWAWVDVLLVVLALVCAVVGVLALRRPPRAVPGPA